MENYAAKVMQQEPLNLATSPMSHPDKDILAQMGALHMTDSQYADHQQWIRNQRDYDRSSHQQGIYYYEHSLQWVLQRIHQKGYQQQHPVQRAHDRFEHQQQNPTQQPIQRNHHQQQQQRTNNNYQQSYNNSPSHQNRNNKSGDRERRDNNKKNNRNNHNHHHNDRNFKHRDWYNHGKSHSFTSEDLKRNQNQTYRSLSPTPPGSSKSSSPGAPEKSFEKDVEDSGSNTSSCEPSYAGVMKVSKSAPLLASEPSKHVNQWIDSNFEVMNNGLSYSAEHLNLPPVKIIKRPPPMIKRVNSRITQYDHQNPFDYYLARVDEIEIKDPPSVLRNGLKWDRISVQMWEKFQIYQQSRETYQSKILLWRDLHNAMKSFPLFHHRALPKWGLFLVGSTISGFGLDTSDIDMCLMFKSGNPQMDARAEAVMVLNDLKNYLSASPFQNFSLINAKVPILRFRDAANVIEVDLNYNNCIGVSNTQLLYSYTQMDWRLRPLALVVKIWAQFHNINDARSSTISSYSLVLMVIHFLQHAVKPAVLPCLHELCPEKFKISHDNTTIDMVEKCDANWKSKNKQAIGELFVRFLDYYSNFKYKEHAISIRTGGVLPIEECKNARSPKNDPNHWLTLCIEEPFDLTNTARSTYDMEIFGKIKNVFFSSYYRLKETKNLDSVFVEPLFTQQQHHQPMSHLNQIKYMMLPPNGHSVPIMASDIVKS